MSTITELAHYYSLNRFPRFSIRGREAKPGRNGGRAYVVAKQREHIVFATAPVGTQPHVSGITFEMTLAQARALRDGLGRLLDDAPSIGALQNSETAVEDGDRP